MKLHTKDQAPKEGGVETPKEERKPVRALTQWWRRRPSSAAAGAPT